MEHFCDLVELQVDVVEEESYLLGYILHPFHLETSFVVVVHDQVRERVQPLTEVAFDLTQVVLDVSDCFWLLHEFVVLDLISYYLLVCFKLRVGVVAKEYL